MDRIEQSQRYLKAEVVYLGRLGTKVQVMGVSDLGKVLMTG